MYASGCEITGSFNISGGSISISNSAGTQTFSVSNQGEMFANKGTIGGWSFNGSTLTGNKVGLAKTSSDNDIAIWAGNASSGSALFKVTQGGSLTSTSGSIANWIINSDYLSSNSGMTGLSSATGNNSVAIWAGSSNGYNGRGSAKFRVTNAGKMYADGAEITGSTFVIKNGTATAFEITSTGKMYIRPSGTGGGWYVDANDFAGPWYGSGGVTEDDGFVGLNCNSTYPNRLMLGRENGHSAFWVDYYGVVHCSAISYWS